MLLILVFPLSKPPNLKAVGGVPGLEAGFICENVSFKNKSSALIRYSPSLASCASIFKLAILPLLILASFDFEMALSGSK